MRRMILFAAVALLVSRAAAQDSPPGSPPADLGIIVQRLGDPAFTARERAQQELERLPLTQRDALSAIAEKMTDEEIKARLREQVGRMDDRLVIEKPPISLEVRDASLPQVVATLERSLQVKLSPAGPFDTDERFTLKAGDQPFWEVIWALGRKRAFGMTAVGGVVDPPQFAQVSFAHQQAVHGVAIMANNAQMLPDSRISIRVGAGLDPRIAVVDFNPLIIDDVRDELGNRYTPEVTPQAAKLLLAGKAMDSPQARYYQAKTWGFAVSGTPGNSLTVRGSVSLQAEMERKTVVIEKATDHMNEAMPLGDSTVTLRNIIRSDPKAEKTLAGFVVQIKPNDSTILPPEPPEVKIKDNGIELGGVRTVAGTRMVLDSEGTGGGFFMGPAASGEKTRIQITDAKGRPIADYALPRGLPITSVHVAGGIFQEPLKFTFTFPTRTREVKVPFELKGIAIVR